MKKISVSRFSTLALAATLLVGITSANLAHAQSTDGADSSTEEQSCDPDGSCTVQRTRVFVLNTAPLSMGDADSDGTGVRSKSWHFGVNAEISYLSHKDFDSLEYGAGLHLRWSPRKHEGRVAGAIGLCGDNVMLSASVSYAYRVAGPVYLGLGVRSTSCYDWWADGQENQVLRTIGAGPVLHVGPVRAFLDVVSFARFRPGQKRQMGGAPMVGLEVDLDFLHW